MKKLYQRKFEQCKQKNFGLMKIVINKKQFKVKAKKFMKIKTKKK